MADDYVATSTVTIDAPPTRVWQVITDPAAVKEIMFGTELVTDSQGNNASAEAAQHSQGMWDRLVVDVKQIVERA
jgi:uncharacterized protein YndB with AHSA1/START domain